MKNKKSKKELEQQQKKFDKAILICLIAIIILIWGGILLKVVKYQAEQTNNLDVTYIWGDEVTLKGTQKETVKKVTIKNDTNQNEIYSLKWDKIFNGFNEQSELRYSITSEGETAAGLVESQVPNIETDIFKSVIIPSKSTHTYEIKLIYLGKERKNKFTGTIKVTNIKQDKEQPTKQIEKKIKEKHN